MSANKRSSILLCLSLAVACLLGVFAIMDASSAIASQGEDNPPATVLVPVISVFPMELDATLHPDEVLTQTLWITNSGDSDLTFTIYEMTSTVRNAGFTMEPAATPLVDPQVRADISQSGKTLAIIFLREKPDLSPASLISNRSAKAQYVYIRLLETASHSRALFQWLKAQGTLPQRFLAANAIAANLDLSQLAVLANNPLVRQISPNRQSYILPAQPAPATAIANQPESVEWNIAKIRADEAWMTFNVTGEGVVVATMDTGVEYDHPALVNSYRGNLGGGSFDHNYNWFDFVSGEPVPLDDIGHATLGAGIVSGDDGAGNQIGVAPGAQWIAVRACDHGSCSDVDLLAAFDWMLAPTRLDGTGADPSKAPDVLLGMLGGSSCSSFFEQPIQALVSAGITPVFAPGGAGPGCSTVGSPADYGNVLAAGATDEQDVISPFSARGPAFCNPELIKPDLAAPGVEIRTSEPGGGYITTSGTSWSAAHLAGAVAMVLSADPFLGLEDLKSILFSTALCIDTSECGSGACPEPNNVYGHGRIDVFEAVAAALGNPPQVNLPWLSEAPLTATLGAGESMAVAITFDSANLEVGTYPGALGILSNDPNQPIITIPAILNVAEQSAPAIVIDPLSMSVDLPMDGAFTETLSISNQGDLPLSFSLTEVSSTLRVEAAPFSPDLPEPLPAGSPPLVDAEVYTRLIFLNQERLIIYLRQQPDLSQLPAINGKVSRLLYIYHQLLENASNSEDLFSWLVTQDAQPRRLLTANAIAATLNRFQLAQVISSPLVARVGINLEVQIQPEASSGWPGQQAGFEPAFVEWNIAKIRANEAWSTFGITGQGVVIGSIETGVKYDHPALNTQYRGNLGGGVYDHNYNWFDLIAYHDTPYDDNNHSTMGMGIALGDDGGTNQIGVAPGAKWMAVKVFNAGGGSSYEIIHAGFEWMMAPTNLDGLEPDPSQAPDVLLGLWYTQGCSDEFNFDIDLLRAAGIIPVFAPGGFGPACFSMGSPGGDSDTISAGATDDTDQIAVFSSRGPACNDGSIKPDVTAPGVQVRSSAAIGPLYQIWDGTCVSTAHLAGAAAMVLSANQELGQEQLEQVLFDTAVCREELTCGGAACPEPNNTYGYGRIDVFEAVSATLGSNYDIPWLSESAVSGTIQPGETINISVTFDAAGLEPGTYTGGIAVHSNDPLAPLITLPVTLTVSLPCEPVNVQLVEYTPSDPHMGSVITFTASTTGTLPIAYDWSFGDGGEQSGQVVTHSYTEAGIYQVTLTASNACSTQVVILVLTVDGNLQRTLLPLIGR